MARKKQGYKTTEEIADLLGLTKRRIQQLTKDGIITATKTADGNQYELISTVRNYITYLRETVTKGGKKSEEINELQKDKIKSDIELKQSQIELHKIKAKIANGEYLDKTNVEQDYHRFFNVFKKFVLGIPPRIAAQLNGYIDPLQIRTIEAEIDKDIKNQLTNFVIASYSDKKQ